MLWDLFLVNYLSLFSLVLFVFKVFIFCCCSLIRNKLPCFLILTLFQWNKVKQLPILVLKGCLCVGVPLCSMHVPTSFDGRAGSELSTGHIFLQCVLAVITLAWGEFGDGVARDRARCELGLILWSVAISTLFGVGLGRKVLKQKPWVADLSQFHSL